MTPTRTALAIILAAGDGTRMKSARTKMLHEVAGRAMPAHVVDTVSRSGVDAVALVVGRDGEAVAKACALPGVSLSTFEQTERLGTAHAVLAAREAIAAGYNDLLVTYGDTPLVTAETLARAREGLAAGHDVVVIGFETDRPTGYGRLLVRDGNLQAIREEKDASDEERKVTLCNSGLMAINGRRALDLLTTIGNGNAKGEYYLTDVVEVALAAGGSAGVVMAELDEVAGCNNRAELAELERIWQTRRRREMMLSGVTLIAPETVFFSYDTEIGPDTLVEPNVWFGPGVTIAGDVTIHAFSHIEGATVEAGSQIGPYARLRPGAVLHEDAKVGNFCEVKNGDIGKGAKVNHLTYIGDAEVGARTNIGAGTITCNYDGANKAKTIIGEDSFIGSNSALVAPVTIGAKSYVGSGSVITDDVPDNALALGRARQTVKEGRAEAIRERALALKAANKAAGQK
ncbi:bifunctional UDP-N-acetylglucosamine diphosphorylase/glucosamine-1-phosphate N-acetyltransferase GlmU [Martelella endophytica]|uniref:Bifunctional protein GlmU n=1 Tax=Martelella endophytica TaxID=1486262 RepID=A0A0D5LS41_MAREN|nr:bifunctional UDP-N-acetylglucosamine diphosphorylase/glucosamine-1-phosphate N-acetyltransferase GlmU [Martelella endophytica]AJY46886.1 bifunctional N-acetylglucosamine-1-phosphate uridyltransferase/glucosamine-1-phosphate acetyltransferase [Martelella endophytica]